MFPCSFPAIITITTRAPPLSLFLSLSLYIYIYIYICLLVCVRKTACEMAAMLTWPDLTPWKYFQAENHCHPRHTAAYLAGTRQSTWLVPCHRWCAYQKLVKSHTFKFCIQILMNKFSLLNTEPVTRIFALKMMANEMVSIFLSKLKLLLLLIFTCIFF